MALLGFTQFIPKVIKGLRRNEIAEPGRAFLQEHCIKEAGEKNALEYLMGLSVKRCTIRKVRKRPIKIGETLYLYKTYQQRAEVKLGEVICESIFPISINTNVSTVRIGELKLSKNRVKELAIADGFESTKDFFCIF